MNKDDISKIASRSGIPESDVLKVLQAAGQIEDQKASPVEVPAGFPAITSTAEDGSEKAELQSQPTRERLSLDNGWNDIGLWAGAVVIVISVLIYLGATDGFSTNPEGKIGALVIGALGSLASLACIRRGREGWKALEEIGWATLTVLFCLTIWALMWVMGLWPGEWVASPSQLSSKSRYWESGSEIEVARASLLLLTLPTLLGIQAGFRRGAYLAGGLGFVGLHMVLGALIYAVGLDPDNWSDELQLLLAFLYTGVWLGVGSQLEGSHRGLAGYTHVFAIIGGFTTVGMVGVVTVPALGIVSGLGGIALATFLGILWARSRYLAAAVLGLWLVEIWLYTLWSGGALMILLLSLLAGFGGIGIVVFGQREIKNKPVRDRKESELA